MQRLFLLDPTDSNIGVDAFNQNRIYQLCYEFPPTALIPKAIQKNLERKGSGDTRSIPLAPESVAQSLRLTGPPIKGQSTTRTTLVKLSAWLLSR